MNIKFCAGMKIMLLGATGRTGKKVLQYALEKGHRVNCLVRDKTKLPLAEGIEVFEGQPTDPRTLNVAISGCDAVINVLNVSRKNDFPWSRLRAPKNLISASISGTIAQMDKSKVKRIISCSAWGVHETKKDIPLWFRSLIEWSNIGVAYADHERQETLLEKSSLNWTIVRPVGLTNSKGIGKIQESFDNKPKPNLTIGRNAVANYLVNCLEREDLIYRKTVISAQ